ncbi:MAG: hypothetical protein KIT82_04045 [Bradyrhizobium sp.]|nr:hypothetical protein [Bradyrhizobium sp.]
MTRGKLHDFRQSMVAPISTVALIVLILCGSLLLSREAQAGPGMSAAAATANAGIGACGSNAGKVLYDCVAGVLDRLAGQLGGDTGQTAGALRSAASQLRAAANKAQALSAISRCRAAIAGALRQVRAIGGGHVAGWGGGPGAGCGLQAIGGVLSRAAALIQQKG